MKKIYRKIYRRLPVVILSLIMLISISACSGDENDTININATEAEQTIPTENEQTIPTGDESTKETTGNDTIENNASSENGTGDNNNDKSDVSTEVSTKNPSEEPTEQATFSQPEITLLMVGDILLHDRVQDSSVQEDGSYNYDAIFENVSEEIKAVDLAIVNQEVIIGGKNLGISGYPNFNAPFELGDALVKTGFDVVCHGTNHALDKGRKGLLSCLQFWKTTYPHMAILGINETQEEKDEIYVYEQDGIKIAILNYTYGTNGISLPSDMPFAVDLLKKEEVIEDIKEAERIADFTVVCPHWGTEYVLEQTGEQERWAKIFLENGVDLVIGTHPHVIEPIEMLTDPSTGNQMLVYYSIGNFVNWTGESGKGKANRMVGGMAEVTISLDEGGNPIIKDYGVTAVVSHVSYGTNGVYTMKLSDYTQELSLTSAMIKQDSSYSKDYLVSLCNKVWGDMWE